MTAALVAMCLLAPPQEAQEPADPFDWARRLDDLDLSWRWGEFEFEAGGALDLELYAFGKEAPGVHVEEPALRSDEYDRREESDSPELGARLRLFLDGFFREWLEYSAELRADGTTAGGGDTGARIEQLWARLKAPGAPADALQVGKFAAPLGNFISRSSARRNPLTTWPLPYDHVTTLAGPGDAPAAILARRDRPDVKDWVVPVWREVYGTGVMALGGLNDFSAAAAVTNSAPATLPGEWDTEAGDADFLNITLHAAWAVDIGTRAGATWSRGPWAHRDPAGAPGDPEDSYQTLAGLDLEHASGDLVLFAEVFWTRLEGALAGDLDLWTWYAEGKFTFVPGLFGAARVAQMFFGDLGDAAGESHQWDRDVTRLELGGGWFFTANLFVKTTLQLNFQMGGREPSDDLLLTQVGFTF